MVASKAQLEALMMLIKERAVPYFEVDEIRDRIAVQLSLDYNVGILYLDALWKYGSPVNIPRTFFDLPAISFKISREEADSWILHFNGYPLRSDNQVKINFPDEKKWKIHKPSKPLDMYPPSGRYYYDNYFYDIRFPKSGKFAGYILISRSARSRHNSWAPVQRSIDAILEAIRQHSKKYVINYALMTGICGLCRTQIADMQERMMGIHFLCLSEVGWELELKEQNDDSERAL